jgi:hypothetical protein
VWRVTQSKNSGPTHVDGYGWLQTRVGAALTRVTELDIAPTSAMAADDLYLHPIFRTFQQAVRECLLSALDHLRFVGWSLQQRNEPFPYAQFTVVRTAITAASTALWMLSGSDADERRIRALEFYLRDYKSDVDWINTVKRQPQYQTASVEEQQEVDARLVEWESRQGLIVEMANELLNPPTRLTRRTLVQRTSDTEMVKTAGAATPALGKEGYDPAVTLLNTWQNLSGYAHARPWSAERGRQFGEIDPDTGLQHIRQKGDPDQLLDAAFRALEAAEEAIRRLIALSAG